MNEMLHEINTGSVQVAGVSNQISTGAQTLAQGATEQASTIAELSQTIDDVAIESQQTTELAKQASSFVDGIKQNAEEGTQKIELMMRSIQEINEATHAIEKVIKDIDDIAFQTNILALNAAVEAARAGEAGKGFAVVADEVRNLAAKSAESAKNTATLIESTIRKAATGAENADKTVASLTEIIAGINQSVQFLSEISISSEKQSVALTQVSEGVDMVSTVVQQNSATSQEAAAASEELNSQAIVLQNLVSEFKLQDLSSLGVTKPADTRNAYANHQAPQEMNFHEWSDNGKY